MATKSLRFAHSEGHTDLCYDESGRYLLSGGSDGDVRIWEGIDDDDPLSHRVGDIVYAVACKNDRFYTAGNDNSLHIYHFKEGQSDGVLLRFTSPITHICFNKSGNKCFAGSSDFQLKIINVETSEQKLLQGHDAPVLSLAVNPLGNKLASSSCDGTVRVWDADAGKEIKRLSLLKKSNDFSLASSLCRLTWTSNGKHLLIPVGSEVHGYSSDTWEKEFTLQDADIKELISVLSLSPCGKYLAAACKDGVVIVWDLRTKSVVTRDQHDKKLTITALCWNPNGKDELAFADNHGNLGLMEGLLPVKAQTKTDTGQDVATASVDTMADLFGDDDDDDMMLQASGMEGGGEGQAELPMDSDDDGIGQQRHARPIAFDDDDSKDTDFTGDQPAPPAPAVPYVPVPRGPEPTPLQPAFQPGSTPEHLAHRFMVWNFVGFIRQYNTEEENSIDVEFHDTATHHPIHVTNTLNHSIAGLSAEAVALACESDEDTPSKLVCMHYSSADTNKEWTANMPEGEDIQALTLGDGWVAAATDARQVRLFTVGGLQKEIFSIPGPVVAMAGHMNQLMVVFHKGVGLPGDQNLGVLLLTVSGRKRALVRGDSLPITHKSTLAWLGFSHEGTPIALDSTGIMFMLNRKFSNTWTQVADTRSNCKGKSDHNFVVGVQENPAQIRCIACKGARYPQTLPRPVMSIISFQLPLCEGSTEKGQLEESYWRSLLLSNHLSFWSEEGFEVEESARSQALMTQQEMLMKMFALACKTQRESRALEVCELMPTQHAVQLAVKYATRLRSMQLATRLSELAQQKAEEEQGEEQEEEEVHYARPKPSRRRANGYQDNNNESEEEQDMEEDTPLVGDDGDHDGTGIYEEIPEEPTHKGPMLSFKSSEKTPKSLSNSQSASRKNPFKVGSQTTPNSSGARGSSVFDSLQKSFSKSQSSTPEDKPLKNKKRGFAQITLLGKKKDKQAAKEKENSPRQPTQTAFQLWFESNKDDLTEESPDVSEADLAILAARRYKELTDEEKKDWQDKASQGAEDERKRKREGSDSTETPNAKDVSESTAAKKKKPLSMSTNSKLAGFAFSKS